VWVQFAHFKEEKWLDFNVFGTLTDKVRKNIRGYEREGKYKNDIIYDMKNYMNYLQAIIDFISGMTDSFAVKVFNELTSF